MLQRNSGMNWFFKQLCWEPLKGSEQEMMGALYLGRSREERKEIQWSVLRYVYLHYKYDFIVRACNLIAKRKTGINIHLSRIF